MTTHDFLRCCFGLALSASLFAQAGRPTGPGAGGGTPTPTNPTSPTRPGVGQQPGNFPGNNPFPEMGQRPVILMGKVAMEDGTPPPDSVTIQLVCRGNPRSVAFTDSKGGFSVDLNSRLNDATLMDASQPSGGDWGGGFGGGPSMGRMSSPQGGLNGISERDLMGCDLQAALAGFRSEQIHLGTRRALDNPEVGTIILRRLANVEGLTISATSALAPKDAKKAFEKARNAARKQKWDEAEKEYQKAVDLYPKYAAAWFQLGLVHERQKNDEGARKCYAQALAADPKFVSPYQQLASMAAREQKWQEVIDDTDRLLRLNPVDFPQAWLFNSIGNYYLKNLEAAEKSAREGISHDAAHHYAAMNHVLGVILAQKQDYAGAAEQLRDYIHFAPNAADVDQVKQQLSEVEKVLGPEAKKQ